MEVAWTISLIPCSASRLTAFAQNTANTKMLSSESSPTDCMTVKGELRWVPCGP